MQKVIKVTESNAIKKKMMAATSMLLVAVIMLVSASYAWFTLSTAPEVTGITTAVGANGNLEMALANDETWKGAEPKTSVGTSLDNANVDVSAANESWGNLVALSDNTIYGLDKITLMPSRLNFSDGKIDSAFMLKTPIYGTDGRVMELSPNAIAGVFDEETKGFVENKEGEGRGVRAIGVASAMTDRQLIYRGALSTISSKMNSAVASARNSLLNNGSAMADVIIKHATSADGQETYTQKELAPIVTAVGDLLEATKAIRDAWEASIVGMAASAVGEENEELTEEVVKGIEANMASPDTYTVNKETSEITIGTITVDLDSNMLTMYNSITLLEDKVNSANSELATLVTAGSDAMKWDEISGAVSYLVNPTYVSISGVPATDLSSSEGMNENFDKLYAAVTGDGLQVQMPSQSGAYADIAEFCGDYWATIQLSSFKFPMGGADLTIPSTGAKMITTTGKTETTGYLGVASNAVDTAAAPSSASEEAAAITDYYGYSIDLLFRTNAANSNLLLQVDEAQRVYDDSENEATQGAGSSMTFAASSDVNFTTDAMKRLMSAIRVVFLDGSGNILSFAKLATDEATTTADGLKAELQLCNHTVNADGSVTINDVKSEQVLLENMPQNTQIGITAIVYLDGDAVQNDDVATTAQSMTGSMNLQFSSSANLVPMDNTALFEGAAE